MSNSRSVSTDILSPGDLSMISWEEAFGLLKRADTCWLSTTRPDGRPHVMPLRAVAVGDALYLSTGEASQKGMNLARNPHCAITTSGYGFDAVLEGEAVKVTDEATLHQVADAYLAKYEWPREVRDGAFYGENAPTAGPAPYGVYRIESSVAFLLGQTPAFGSVRWTFA